MTEPEAIQVMLKHWLVTLDGDHGYILEVDDGIATVAWVGSRTQTACLVELLALHVEMAP